MKTLFLKNAGALVLMATMASASALPPPPLPPTVSYGVTNFTAAS